MIAGFTVAQDISARDWQKRNGGQACVSLHEDGRTRRNIGAIAFVIVVVFASVAVVVAGCYCCCCCCCGGGGGGGDGGCR